MLAKELGRAPHLDTHNINPYHESFKFKLDVEEVSEKKHERTVGVYDILKPE